ncbi:MAG: XTP/dITP diphosphohydrolase [Alphaproteobacteria bacterium]|jgi:XTP/dITP diphosphohydrolase
MKNITIASHNKKKAAELQAILTPLGIELITADSAGLPDVEETETTFHGNARLKVESAFAQVGGHCIADDSGFCVDALNGAPGLYSARYEGGYGRVLKEIENKQGHARSAHFICVIAYKNNIDDIHYFEGKVEGLIPEKASGKGGFGYDPIFIANGEKITFAEMDPKSKNRISARSIAVAKLIEHLKKEA